MSKKIIVSVIVLTRGKEKYVLGEQSFRDYELIVVPGDGMPAEKRNRAARKARGEFLAFIDDDAYPDKNWLKNAVSNFSDPQIAAVGGPGVTPPADNLKQQVSGLIWESWLGAGPNTYRCRPCPKRFVDDYPTFNLLIRKADFLKIGGINSEFWPGEDTQLCHDLVYKLNKKILYDPRVLVYHHRRPVFLPHLRQISRYGFRRGHFAKTLPQTSRRLFYFAPALLVLSLPVSFPVYFLLVFLEAIRIFLTKKNLLPALLFTPAVFLTHLVYGVSFLRSFSITSICRWDCHKEGRYLSADL
ncbi:glycosyltransferase [Candidatus Gottesmanbacteria bacterium]|nr:glycosyltransferase [Candidatus Gottesmanbacteria bacterium]